MTGIDLGTKNLLTKATNISGSEIVSATYKPHPASVDVTVTIFSVDGGTLDIDEKLTDGTWVEIDSQTVTANTALKVRYDVSAQEYRARWTAGAALGKVVIDAHARNFEGYV